MSLFYAHIETKHKREIERGFLSFSVSLKQIPGTPLNIKGVISVLSKRTTLVHTLTLTSLQEDTEEVN